MHRCWLQLLQATVVAMAEANCCCRCNKPQATVVVVAAVNPGTKKQMPLSLQKCGGNVEPELMKQHRANQNWQEYLHTIIQITQTFDQSLIQLPQLLDRNKLIKYYTFVSSKKYKGLLLIYENLAYLLSYAIGLRSMEE